MITHNQAISVTDGGDLFDVAAFDAPEGEEGPFDSLDLCRHIPQAPNMLSPMDALCDTARASFLSWSDTIWIKIGSLVEPDPVPGPGATGGGGLTPAHIRAIIEPVIQKEKLFKMAGCTESKIQLLLASAPPAGSPTPDAVVLLALTPKFLNYLSISSGATAGDEL